MKCNKGKKIYVLDLKKSTCWNTEKGVDLCTDISMSYPMGDNIVQVYFMYQEYDTLFRCRLKNKLKTVLKIIL